MATLALSVAGQFVGGLVGGPVGATVGRALGALAGNAIDQTLFGQSVEPTGRLNDLSVQTSQEGAPIPRIYGWNRLSGEIIWATQLAEYLAEDDGGKGIGETAAGGHYTYSANFAVGVCEGEISHFGRIWADGKLLDQSKITARFYKGSTDQLADSLIEAKEGADNVPAYRGLAYVVFDGLPLADYGNRIPQFSFEICRAVGDLERDVTAITLIPGATEYGYDPRPLSDHARPGVAKIENAHQSGRTSDWQISLDQLCDLYPNLESVALVVSWFGTDLRCGQCQILPGIENRQKNVANAPWQVGNMSRADAHLITEFQGGPAYGGTPNDASVINAIIDLKARGLKVTFYPFVLMDIPPENTLDDPYGNDAQASYPWRGRITCHPAIGQVGSPNKSASAASQTNDFLGSAVGGDFALQSDTVDYTGPDEWSYRRMILHYAHLCTLAGGVDAFLIGSELRGLTQVRSDSENFPFVEGLEVLAQDVRAIMGISTLLTYGADWSEYFGYHPDDGSGDVWFHLDNLWASSAIDAIGIDNYLPLADWRESSGHLDAQAASSIYQRSYLQGNIAGGEGYDWYYASALDRQNQVRTPITDGAYGEPWVFRPKDLRNWWQNAHHNRPGGVREAVSSAYVPEAKPIWFTEIGCGAVDKGANQPNRFADPKSDEDGAPHFSSGASDPAMQRQFLRAHLNYWRASGQGYAASNNPISSLYGGPMITTERMYIWTWDARPFPAFPMRTDIWSDGANWLTGHWLNGRSGALSLEELLGAILSDYGVIDYDVSAETLMVEGYRIDRITSPRAAIEPLLRAANLQLSAFNRQIQIARADLINIAEIAADALAARNDQPTIELNRADQGDLPGHLSINFIDRARDYRSANVGVRALARPGTDTATISLALSTTYESATVLAKNILKNIWAGQETIKIALPPSQLGVSVGDTFKLAQASGNDFVITALTDTDLREVEARAIDGHEIVAAENVRPDFALTAPVGASTPQVLIFQLPGQGAEHDKINLCAAIFADPWPGFFALFHSIGGAENRLATVSKAATLGLLMNELPAGPTQVWDRINSLEVELSGGHLASLDADAVLAGANRLAVLTNSGQWEIIGFTEAKLTGERTYKLTGLLRGLRGSAAFSASDEGNQVVVLNDAIVITQLEIEVLEQDIALKSVASGDGFDTAFIETIVPSSAPLLPLAPVHLQAKRAPGQTDIAITWHRQSRLAGQSWATNEVPLDAMPEAYLIQIYNGATLVREDTTTTPNYLYPEADQLADFGSAPGEISLNVAQASAVFGPGFFTPGVFNV